MSKRFILPFFNSSKVSTEFNFHILPRPRIHFTCWSILRSSRNSVFYWKIFGRDDGNHYRPKHQQWNYRKLAHYCACFFCFWKWLNSVWCNVFCCTTSSEINAKNKKTERQQTGAPEYCDINEDEIQVDSEVVDTIMEMEVSTAESCAENEYIEYFEWIYRMNISNRIYPGASKMNDRRVKEMRYQREGNIIEQTITFELCFISQFKCNGLHDSFEIKWNITI